MWALCRNPTDLVVASIRYGVVLGHGFVVYYFVRNSRIVIVSL